MVHAVGKHLVELDPAAQAIADQLVGVLLLDLLHQPRAHRDGDLVKLALEAHDSCHPAAVEGGSDLLDGSARHQADQVEPRLSDVLFLEVAGSVVGHATGDRTHVPVELSRLIQVAQVLTQVVRVAGDRDPLQAVQRSKVAFVLEVGRKVLREPLWRSASRRGGSGPSV